MQLVQRSAHHVGVKATGGGSGSVDLGLCCPDWLNADPVWSVLGTKPVPTPGWGLLVDSSRPGSGEWDSSNP